MPYQATVYTLMISGPSDAEEEKRVLRDCVNRWNDANSGNSTILLHPSDYRTGAPAVLANPEDERPQAVINEFVVKPSDWLIAVFKDKFGTPSGKAESGTLEEIQLFRKLNPEKPISVYFYVASRDRKVKKYKKQLKGLWKEYKDCNELRNEFSANLSQIVYNDTYFRHKFIDWRGRIEDRAQILLTEIAHDANGTAVVSMFTPKEMKIETNGHKYIGFDTAFKHLYQRGLIENIDGKGEAFRLTDSGKGETEASILSRTW